MELDSHVAVVKPNGVMSPIPWMEIRQLSRNSLA